MSRISSSPSASEQGWYRRVWRWHFYAGLFVLPFAVLLASTGMVYLFKPQIDAWQDRPFDQLALASPPHSLNEQIAAARTALPDARFSALELRSDPRDAARVLMMRPDGATLRVYVRPDTLEILRILPENSRISKIDRTIHGELLAGEAGAIFVELVGAWAIVMFITGLYLWWPRGATGLGGVLYPRWGKGRRFLRDLHAVAGIWISVTALFFLVSALPWTKVWGGGLKQIETALGHNSSYRDWTTGPASEHAEHMHAFAQSASTLHEQHELAAADVATSLTYDQVAAKVLPMRLADPVLVSAPTPRQGNWTVRSDAQNRPLRVTLEIDPQSGEVVRRRPFADGPFVDRMVGIGVAAHEGQLFGWINQALGVFTATGVITLAVTSGLMWWRRRPSQTLGAPPMPSNPPRLAPLIGATIVLLGCLLPMLGLSLIAVLALEYLVLSRLRVARNWLGLPGAGRLP